MQATDRSTLSQERLKEVVFYDPETGVFSWKSLTDSMQRKTKIGDVAGGVTSTGYVRITIDGRGYLAHRLAILYVDGYLPEHTVDHINRNIIDNRYDNLREASHQCQVRNRSMMVNNNSGICGVWWRKGRKRWVVSIGNKGRSRFVAMCKTLEEAAYLRLAAEQCLGYGDCAVSSAANYIKNLTLGK